jgi:hypothetical protein
MHINLPRWAFPHDLATVVEFSRMTQAVLETATRRCPASTDVIEFVGGLAVEFEARHFDTQWGEDDAPDFLEATESFFEAAAKPEWFPSDEDRTRRADLDFLVARMRRAQTAEANAAQALDADAIAQAERDDEVCDAAGKSIAAALKAAGVGCDEWGDGIVTVRGWLPYRELRVCAGVEHDPDGDHILVDIVSSLFEEDDDGGPAYTALVEGLEPLPEDIVDRVRATLEYLDGGAA